MTELLQRVEERLRTVHRSQSGAVALLCLASLLILFMCVLIMFDAGRATQHKIDIQMAGDTAAHSAASTQARAMNVIAFANVGKRTAIGIHNMYVHEYPAYFQWWRRQRQCCCNCFFGCWTCCWTGCFNWLGNLISLAPFLELIDYLSFAFSNDIHDILDQLDTFQTTMADTAGWWAAAEAQIRGVRNNANMVLFWPDPRATNQEYRRLPIARSNDTREACLAPFVWGRPNPVTRWTLTEYYANYDKLVDDSLSSPNIASDGPAEVADGSAFLARGSAITRSHLACNQLGLGFLAFFPPTIARVRSRGAPYFVDVANSARPWDNGNDQLRMSNFIYTYKHTPDLFGKHRDNYEFMPSYRYQRADNHMNANSGPGGSSSSATMPSSGMWSMARSEFYFPPASHPNTRQDGLHRMWLFHPGWVGKLRPVMLPDEGYAGGSYTWNTRMPRMVGEALPTGRGLATGLFGISGVTNYDSAGFNADIQYLVRNVAPDMHGYANHSGNDNRHIMDGMAK